MDRERLSVFFITSKKLAIGSDDWKNMSLIELFVNEAFT